MTITEKFFVECVKCGIKSEKIKIVPSGLDYNQLYKLCVAHSMSVIVVTALSEVFDKLYARFVDVLKKLAERQVKKDVQSEYDLNLVLKSFEQNGINYMPLKGYYLKKLYPNTAMRYASDWDLLIDVKQIKAIRKIMQNLCMEVKRFDEHHDIFYNPTTKTVFELHKTLFVGKLKNYFKTGFERAEVAENKECFYELSKEDFYISILAHSAYHFTEDAGVGIRYLADIYLYRKTYNLNEDYLDKELAKCDLKKFKEEFEKVSSYLFDGADANDFTKTLAKHILQSSILQYSDMKLASEVASNKGQVGDKKARKKTFWRKIFLTKEQMQFLFPVLKKIGWLMPLFHVVRWVKVMFTRPKALGQLKGYKQVELEKVDHMDGIRKGLGIENF